jgi:hypothetical protein
LSNAFVLVADVDEGLLELELLELLLDDVDLLSDPQPDSTTARAVTAAAAPVNADFLMCELLLILECRSEA